ncbi:MAG: hypothetical protein QGD94_00875 [Planctomycetia bacterium]|nr:hypothetical protein [Planctomycetia bacterium]
MRRTAFLVFVLAVSAVAPEASGGMWSAQPIVVHEWGVSVFDWAKGAAVPETLPAFMYTEKKPGKGLGAPKQRVKDMPPDTGERLKPILYFYPQGYMTKDVKVGVEVRFAYGRANAWWPQVSLYRTPEQTAKAKPVDWEAWRKKHGNRWRKPLPKLPDDERFELVWHDLTLTKDLPTGKTLVGKKLPEDHWVRRARKVDSWLRPRFPYYVSNGKEVERFLFYEGATREMPAITVLPPRREEKECHLVNVGEEPIYDVFVVYRGGGRRWVKYLAVLPPVPAVKKKTFGWGHDVAQIVSIALPDFANQLLGGALDEAEFDRRTRGKLVEVLTAGEHYAPQFYRGMRDPGDPQPPTKMHHLFLPEAVALEKIWHTEFFESDGLTVVYRESPEYLDEAMPLRIYTDMHHYVMLSRCGLVLNRNLRYDNARAMFDAVRWYANEKSEAKRAANLEKCRGDPFLAVGVARYYLKQMYPDNKRLKELIEKLAGGK